MTFKADMHTHSTCSDGTFTPKELIDRAVLLGLSGLSITDHDTVAAYTPELFAYAESKGLRLCTGVEFSCSLFKENVHVLGYGFDPENVALQALCGRHKKRRFARNNAIIANLELHGMPLPEDKVEALFSSEGVIGRPHIAKLMVEEGYVSTIYDAFRLYLGDEHTCNAPGHAFEIQETLDIIHGAQGKAFIAHPQLISRKKVVRRLLEMNFDGIECYYGNLHINRMREWLQATIERQWLVSGGSDFHGKSKDNIDLGIAWIGEEAFDSIVRLSGIAQSSL